MVEQQILGMAFGVKITLNFVKIVIKIWELLFGWIYAILTNPGQVRKNYTRVRSKPSHEIRDGDTSVIYQPIDLGNPEFIQDFKAN